MNGEFGFWDYGAGSPNIKLPGYELPGEEKQWPGIMLLPRYPWEQGLDARKLLTGARYSATSDLDTRIYMMMVDEKVRTEFRSRKRLLLTRWKDGEEEMETAAAEIDQSFTVEEAGKDRPRVQEEPDSPREHQDHTVCQE